MSDTPETDHAAFVLDDWRKSYDVVLVSFAEELERERDILKKHISIMDISHKTANDEYFKLAVENENLERECNDLRDIFPKILEALESGSCAATCSVDFLREIPREVKLVRQRLERERDLWKENSQSNRDEYYRLAAERDKFSKVIASFQDTVFDLRAERDELKCKLDESIADLKSRRRLYNIQTEQLNNADLRVERTKTYLEEVKSERDLWKLEAERWRTTR